MTNEEQQTAKRPTSGKPKRKSSWLRVLLVTAMLVALFVGSVIAVLFSLESETLKPLVERIVTVATDRSFVLEGDFEADLGRRITVRADRVKMANAVWSSKPYMLDLEQVYAVLDVWALTRGQILLRDVKVNSAMLLFEENPAGTLNWELGDDEPDDDADDTPLKSIPLLLEKAELNDVRIELDLPAFKEPLRIQVDSAKQVNGENDILDLVITGSVNDHPLDITGHIGPFTTLLVGLDIDYDINAKSEYFTLISKGHIDDLIAPKKPEFELELKGADATKLTGTLGVREITRGPLDLKASMKPAGDAFKATIDGALGEFLIDLSADLKALNTVEGLKLDVKARGPDLSVAGAIAGVQGLPPDSFALTGQVEESGGALSFEDVSLTSGENFAKLDAVLPAFPKLKDASLIAAIKGPNLLQFRKMLRLSDAPEVLAVPFEFSGELKKTDQGTESIEVSATIGKMSAKISGPITDYPDFIGTRVDFDARGPDIQAISKAFGLTALPSLPFDANGNVEITNKGLQVHRSDFQIGGNRASISGLLGYEPLLKDSDLKSDVSGNLPELARIADLPDLFPQGNFELSFGFKATGNGIQLDDLKATIDGDSKLNVSGSLGRLPSIDGMDLKVSASSPRIKRLVPPQFQQYPIPDGALGLSGRIRKLPAGFQLDKFVASIGDNKLNLSGTVGAQGSLAGTDLEVSASGPNLAGLLRAEFVRELDIPSSPFEISAALGISDARLSLQKLDFTGAKGRLSGNIELALDDITSSGRFSLQANGNDLNEMIPNTPRFEPARVPFEVRTKGEWNRERISVDNLDITIADAAIDLHGQLDLPPDMRASNIVLSAKGSSLASLGSLQGRPLPGKPFDLDATLDGDIDTVQIERLTVHVGDSDLTGQFRLNIKGKPAAIVKFTSQKMDLAPFLPNSAKQGADGKTAEPATPDQPSEKKSVEKPEDKAEKRTDAYVRLIPNLPVPFEELNSFDLTLKAEVGVLIHPLLTLSKVNFDGRLEDGDLSVEKWSADAEAGNFVGQLDLKTDTDIAKLSISIEGREVALALGDVSADDVEKYPTSNINLKMNASGTSSRQLAASLSGYAQVLTKTGRIRNSIALDLFGSFFSELLSSLNPFAKRDRYTDVVCGVFLFNVGDGIVTIDPGAVLQTDKINIFAKGSVDLNTEKVEVSVDTAARKGIGISVGELVNPFIDIGGTLSDPKLQLNVRSSAIQEVGTLGLTAVGRSLWGRWFAAKDPCEKFVQEAKKQGQTIHVE